MYEASYKKLFNAITDAIDILQKAQQECEEAYIEQREEDIEKNELTKCGSAFRP